MLSFCVSDEDLNHSENAGGIDLNCKEHVSDSETDSQSEDEALIENKAFPQQRFSPVMRPLSSTDVPYRPKPMLVKPEPQLKVDVVAGSAALVNERAAPHVTRPSSSGSVFHPTGAVFKAHMPRLKDGENSAADAASAKGDAAVSVVPPGAVQRGYSVDSSEARPKGGSTGQVKTIHNITMMTQPDKHGIILSTNTQVGLGQHNRHGVILSKMTQKVPKGLPKTMPASKLPPGGSTVRGSRPSVGPIAIASKPVMPQAPQPPSPATPTVCINPMGVALNVHRPQVAAPAAVAPPVSLTILKTPITTVNAAPKVTHENVGTTLMNAPVAMKSLTTAQVVPPRMQPAQAALLANIQRAPPTPVQYILPSFTLQTGPNGKVQNVVQMAMPNAQLHAGSIQLAIQGQPVLQQSPSIVASPQPQLVPAKFQMAPAPVTVATPPIQQKLIMQQPITLGQRTLQMVNPNLTPPAPTASPSHPLMTPRYVTLSQPGQQILAMGAAGQAAQPPATAVVSIGGQQMLTTSGLSHFTLVSSQSQALQGVQSPRILLPTTNK